MIANFFKKSKPANVFNAIVLLTIVFVSDLFLSETIEIPSGFIFNKLGLLILLVFIVLAANFIIGKNNLTKDNVYGLLFMVLLFGAFPMTMHSITYAIANTALLLALRKIYSLRTIINTQQKLFDAGFWIGIAMLFEVWSILFLWLIFAALAIYKKIQFRYLIIPIVGLVIPVFVFFTFHFYLGTLSDFYSHFQYDYLLIHNSYSHLSFQIPLVFFGILLVLTLIRVTPGIVMVNNKMKYTWQLFLNHLIIGLLTVAFIPDKNGSEILFLIFPLAIGIANLIERWRSEFLQHVLIYLTFGLVFLVNYL